MKKHIYTFLLAFTGFILSSQRLQAQVFPYTLTVQSGAYSDLLDPSVISTDPAWDDFDETVSLGFNFILFDDTINTITISDPGAQLYSITNTVAVISPIYSDICNADSISLVSGVGYVTEGTPGNRIFKVEWRNVGLFYEKDSLQTFNNRLNFQVWFYETSNIIEFRYGSYNLPNPDLINDFGGPTLYMANNLPLSAGTGADFWIVSGDGMAPSIDWFDINSSVQPDASIANFPISGLIYHFAPIIPANVSENAQANLNVYPTIVESTLNIQTASAAMKSITIRDLSGRAILTQSMFGTNTSIDVTSLPTGVYFAQMLDNGKVSTARFVKK